MPRLLKPRLLFFVLLFGGIFMTYYALNQWLPSVVFEVGNGIPLDNGENVPPSLPPLNIDNNDGDDNNIDFVHHRNNENTMKVAIIADAGLNEASVRVLRLIRDEKADAVLHQGDLDYVGKAGEFFQRIDDILGPTFPYFLSMGNYEAKRGAGRKVAWEAYYSIQKNRLKRFKNTRCVLVSSRVTACEFRGMSFVTSAIGVNASRISLDLKELKAAQTKLWGAPSQNRLTTFRFCSWHLPLVSFQVGFREGVPWMASPHLVAAYESCRERGAVILTGHEHYYVRSHTITRFSHNASQVKYNVMSALVSGPAWGSDDSNSTRRSEVLMLDRGSSFAVVCGLGGHSVSVPSSTRIVENPHLSRKVHPENLIMKQDPGGKLFYPEITGEVDKSETSSNKLLGTFPPGSPTRYPFGALFCSLSLSKAPGARGACYFKTISGEIVDKFVIQRSVAARLDSNGVGDDG